MIPLLIAATAAACLVLWAIYPWPLPHHVVEELEADHVCSDIFEVLEILTPCTPA